MRRLWQNRILQMWCPYINLKRVSGKVLISSEENFSTTFDGFWKWSGIERNHFYHYSKAKWTKERIHSQSLPVTVPVGSIVILNPGDSGRLWGKSAADYLPMSLAWTRTRRSSIVLQLIYGMTGSPVSIYHNFGQWVIIKLMQWWSSLMLRKFKPLLLLCRKVIPTLKMFDVASKR